jgi:hypothetical protein
MRNLLRINNPIADTAIEFVVRLILEIEKNGSEQILIICTSAAAFPKQRPLNQQGTVLAISVS